MCVCVCIKRAVTIIIIYKNILQVMTTLFSSKVKKNLWNLFDVAIGLRVAPEPSLKSSKCHVLRYVGHSALVFLELA